MSSAHDRSRADHPHGAALNTSRDTPHDTARITGHDTAHDPAHRTPDDATGDTAVDEELRAFAAGVVHDLRTPLSALAGEVDLAQRRDRTQAEYREILTRIAGRTTDLVELTENIALLGSPEGVRQRAASAVVIDDALSAVARRFGARLDLELFQTGARVAGDEELVARGISLLVEHALRQCRTTGRVRLALKPQAAPHPVRRFTEIVIDAPRTGFWPNSWRHLNPQDDKAQPLSTAPVRLRAASVIATACRWSLAFGSTAASETVHLRLDHAGDDVAESA